MKKFLLGIIKLPVYLIGFILTAPLCIIWMFQILGGQRLGEKAIHTTFWSWLCELFD